MADSITIMLVVMGGILSLMILFFVFRTGKIYFRGRKMSVRTPRLKGRSLLRSDEFGTAEVIEYEPLGYGDKAILSLRLRDGRIIKPIYYNSQIVPENPMQAIAGADTAVWYVKGRPLHYTNEEVTQLSEENKNLREEQIKKGMAHKARENELATLPDEMKELIEKMSRFGRAEAGVSVRK